MRQISLNNILFVSNRETDNCSTHTGAILLPLKHLIFIILLISEGEINKVNGLGCKSLRPHLVERVSDE